MPSYDEDVFLPIGKKADISASTLGTPQLIKQLVRSMGEKTVYSFSGEGYTSRSVEEIFGGLTEKGAFVVYEEYHRPDTSYIFSWKGDSSSYLELYFTGSSSSPDIYVTASLMTNDRDKFLFAKEYFKDLELVKADNTGYVFSIIRSAEGQLHFGRLGLAGIPLERDNYPQEVVADYDFVVEDFKSKTPSGRIAIFEGITGSGKTYLTRGLLMDIDNAMFVIVPPSTVASLTGPELLPLLIKQKEAYGTRGPIILILEDADQCLVPRQSDNISSISSLLNLGDGIMGSLIDIRIIATTNAKQDKMDSAILRDCRLSKRIEVKALTYDKANSIFARLTKQKDKSIPPKANRSDFYPKDKMDYTLAQVYKLARNNGWSPPASSEPAIEPEKEKSSFWDDE